jgi:hypothetical protein
MPESYTLQGGSGAAYTNFTVVQPMALFDAEGGNDIGSCPNSRIYRSLAYVRTSDRLPVLDQGLYTSQYVSCTHIRHSLAVMSPANLNFNQIRGFHLNYGINATFTQTDVSAYNITSIRGTAGDLFPANWDVPTVGSTARSTGTSTGAVADPWTTTGAGANLCYRWVDGVVQTSAPLWPWPMNERIKQATGMAGAYTGPCPTCVGGRAARTATDVTADIEALLGSIPSQCRREHVGPQAPPQLRLGSESAPHGPVAHDDRADPTGARANGRPRAPRRYALHEQGRQSLRTAHVDHPIIQGQAKPTEFGRLVKIQ